MPVANIKTQWVNGNFVFSDSAGNVIATWDSANRAFVIPSGATLNAQSGASVKLFSATALTATSAELNAAASATALATDGLLRMGVARATFNPTATAAQRPIAAYALGVTLPINAVVIGGFYEVNTGFTSAGANAGTVALSINGANDLVTATAVSNAIYGTTGLKAIIPKSNTPESTGIKLATAKAITATVAGQALTAGKLTVFLHYVVSAATA